MSKTLRNAKFPTGSVVATPTALEVLKDSNQSAMPFLALHVSGQWGECCPEDAEANNDALVHGGRLLSVYRTAKGVKFWIITEADRSSTCVLLPEDY